MEHKYLDKIKNLEGSPKKVNIFSKKEIEMMKELYEILPERKYNKKQNVRKKAWEQNYNKFYLVLYYNFVANLFFLHFVFYYKFFVATVHKAP